MRTQQVPVPVAVNGMCGDRAGAYPAGALALCPSQKPVSLAEAQTVSCQTSRVLFGEIENIRARSNTSIAAASIRGMGVSQPIRYFQLFRHS